MITETLKLLGSFEGSFEVCDHEIIVEQTALLYSRPLLQVEMNENVLFFGTVSFLLTYQWDLEQVPPNNILISQTDS